MSVMFEVYCRPPLAVPRETELTRLAERYGGRLDFKEEETPETGVCLTFEFGDWVAARTAAAAFREQGEHVEGPTDYD